MNIELAIKLIVKNYFGNDSINVLEAGTAEGKDSKELCQILSNSKIYGFEPDVRYHKEVMQNTEGCSNFYFFDSALSDKKGLTSFYTADRVTSTEHSHWGSSSIFEPKLHKQIHKDIKFNNVVEVKTVDIDSWADENNVKSIQFMWLDLQGAEHKVLSNCKILDTTELIFSEVSLVELYDNIPLYNEYRQMLFSKGFIPMIEQLPWEDAGNVLFVKNNKKEKLIKIMQRMGIFNA